MKMAGKKVWRDAATLILTAKSDKTGIAKSLSGAKKSADRNVTDYSAHFDYKVLMLKRSSKSKFMPNAYVFPGGVLSQSDTSDSWLELFKNFNVNKDDLEEVTLSNVDRPLLMISDVNEAVSRDIALRLTAIRETFEESGVLLHKNDNTSGAYNFSDSSFLKEWREKVHKSPDKLVNLYQELGVYPDIWSLSEFSDWLTPTDLHEQGKRRFDTIFYHVGVNKVPETLLDQQEITAVQWTDPASILDQFYDRQLWLAPPQVYELGKMLRFSEMDKLDESSKERQKHGLKTWLPVRMECDDGMLSLLPGDHMYPDNPDYVGSDSSDTNSAHVKKTIQIKYKGTIEESRGKNKSLNRLEFRDMYDCVPRVNYTSQNNHILPSTLTDFQRSLKIHPTNE